MASIALLRLSRYPQPEMHAHHSADGSPHRHDHSLGHEDALQATRVLRFALALTLLYMVVEAVAGWWSGSLALLADAGHMLGDAGALFLSFVVARIAQRPRDAARTFGYRRAEVIGATANGLLLLALAIWIVVEAADRFSSQTEVKGLGVVLVALVGLLVNLVVASILVRAKDNLNVRSALLHVLGDALGSVAALASGTIILTTGWMIADPIASIVIASLILVGSLRLLRETVHVLMQGAPSGIDCAAVERTIGDTEGVEEVHDLHVWALTAGEPILTAHVVIAPDHHGMEVVNRVVQRLRAHHELRHVTIQPEASAEIVQLRVGDASRPRS